MKEPIVEIKGKYNNAIVFTDYVEPTALDQIKKVVNHPAFKDTTIRIMPDVHAGAGCVIGYTQKGIDCIVPNLVGVDGSCGVLAVNVGKDEVDFKKLDAVIHNTIPSGFHINQSYDRDELGYLFSSITSKYFFDQWSDRIESIAEMVGVEDNRLWQSIGTLGGGNHFIAINKTSDGNHWLVIHSGSRNFGLKVAEYWQKKAEDYLEEYIEERIFEGEELEIIKDKSLAWLDGFWAWAYKDNMIDVNLYAEMNRRLMAKRIVDKMGFIVLDEISTTHNYIDGDTIRKGAVRANKGERVVIPLNMKDGVIFGVGKGNEDWNCSAPHGAGRKLSRGEARRNLTMEDFEASMEGVYSTTVVKDTIDEAPAAYKDASEILAHVTDTLDVIDVAKEIYNFKATK